MDAIGYYGFLARNLPPGRLARAAGLRLWRQATLPLQPIPASVSKKALRAAFKVERAEQLPARLAGGVDGPLGIRSPLAVQTSSAWIRRNLPEEARRAIEVAERSLARRVVVFGREVPLPTTGAAIPLTSPGWRGIDWERDPVAAHRRQNLLRSPSRTAALRAGGVEERAIAAAATQGDGPARRSPGGSDPKRQWIVGRLEEVVHLAGAAALERAIDEARSAAFADAALDRMVDFAAAPRGIQWTCTMEVALRGMNMAIALRLLAGHPRLEERAPALERVLRSLALHLAWIPRHLEDTGVVANNHLVANWLGMLAIPALIPALPGARASARRGARGLAEELMAQTLPDGFGFEGSVPYHRLAVELFLLGDLFAATAKLPLPEPVRARLALAFAATAELIDGRGLAPRIGDDDSGRAIPFLPRDPLELGWLLGLGAARFPGGSIAPWAERPPSLEQIWLVGPPGAGDGVRPRVDPTAAAMDPAREPMLRMARPGCAPPATAELLSGPATPASALPPGRRRQGVPIPRHDSALRHGGIYLLRSRRISVAIACGPNGTGGLGTHGHNDKLSVEICVDGALIVGDPGSGSYSGDPLLRNQLRGTAAHSTVQIDGEEQQPLPLGRLFALPEGARARCLAFESSPDRARFVGEHQGYRRLGASHRRVVCLDRRAEAVEIVDSIRGQGRHLVESRLLIPGEKVRIREGEASGTWVVEIGPEGRPIARLLPVGSCPWPRLDPAWYARGYDQVEAATMVVLAVEGKLPRYLHLRVEAGQGGARS